MMITTLEIPYLTKQARDGDAAAVRALYEAFVGEIYGYVYNQLGNVQDAEDVTSETFLRLVRGLRDYRGESSFRTWLYAIAHNCVRDHWRARGRQDTSPLDDELDEEPILTRGAPADNPRATELGHAVLALLPPHYRRVLELRIMDERSIQDVADELGLTPGNVKVIQHRAIKKAADLASGLARRGQDGLVKTTHETGYRTHGDQYVSDL